MDSVYILLPLLIFKTAILQPFPQSPCPHIFKYLYNGSNWFGAVEIQNGIILGAPNILKIKLGYSIVIPPNTLTGGLELQESREITMERILKNEPVKYRVKFPRQRPLPLVVNIVLNDNMICALQQQVRGYYIRNHINLEHTLYTQLAAQRLAAAGLLSSTEGPRAVHALIPERGEHFDSDGTHNDCGKIHPRFRAKPLIIGGRTVLRGSWPWLAAIYLNLDSTNFICGGNLISEKAILSAAHCFHGKYSTDDYIIMLGRHDITDWNEKGSIARGLDEVLFYPGYTSDQLNFDADIAIAVLRNVVRFTPFIQPICLPTVRQRIHERRGIVVGWGQNQDENENSKPKKIEVNIVSDAECLRSNSQFRLLTSNRTFCAGNRDGRGPCSGDSGSGLMVTERDRWTIVGLVSAALSDPNGGNVCDLNEFVIYGDVRKFLDWIYESLKGV